jgi:large subunit ribosomal protein L13
MHQTTLRSTNRAAARWFVVDASKEVLGRLAVQVARILMGKHRPDYTPFADTGDFVVVTNARDVRVTGRKSEDKVYRHHSGYPGGVTDHRYAWMREKHPEEIVRLAVKRMLPKTTMGRHMLRKLKIYPGADHPHHSQKPETVAFGTVRS